MDTLKDKINMRQLVEEMIGKPKSSTGKYDIYHCPFHSEKTPSFTVYETHAKCYGSCGQAWDCYGFVMHLRGEGFPEAKRFLENRYGGASTPSWQASKPQQAQPTPVKLSEIPSEEWQDQAWRVVNEAEDTLWSDKGDKARAYLYGRGLTDETIKACKLGYMPGKFDEWRKVGELNVPCGIIIPHIYKAHTKHGDDSDLWGIKVRRAAGDIRYQQVKGGNIAGHIYLASEVVPGQPLIIDEGEFNAMILNQCKLGMSAVAIGSTGNKHINPRWFGLLASAPVIYARMDRGSGDDALRVLRQFSKAVHPLITPEPYKDPNDLFIAEGDFAVWAWADGMRHHA